MAISAMAQTVDDMKTTLTAMTDVHSLLKQHPWIATGSAAAIGFITGSILSMSLRHAPTNEELKTTVDVQQGIKGRKARTKRSIVLATAGRSVVSILQALMQGFVAKALRSVEQPQSRAPSPFGSTASADPKGHCERMDDSPRGSHATY